ncbi:MAG: Asp-tRNA(Asn)/Glu-tRNA(Gln) amidotransferase subunit GatC [Simkaniaceae bacterium]|nr:Asp-tRNA(Asn)/Glu-tRNA(Gln) amidotransferase subunit GatC [Candidatus Sacchlamyda saccharinae]
MSLEEEKNSKYLASLVRIELSEEQEKVFNQNLDKILGYMHLLDEVDTQDVLPCSHVLETAVNVMGEDEEIEPLDRETLLKNAPDSVSGMIKVPPVMEE